MNSSPLSRRMEDWAKLIGDMPSATAILDHFLHHAELLAFKAPMPFTKILATCTA